VSAALPTVRSAAWVYGEGPDLDDPAELCHEAAKLRPATVRADAGAMSMLEARPELQATIERCVRRRTAARECRLPEPALPGTRLDDALRCRSSERRFGPGSIDLAAVGTLAWAAYGIARSSELGARRTVPSGGALYPLELYLLALRVDGLDAGVYHYDPPRHALCRVADTPAGEELERLSPFPELVVPAALVLLVTAVFWRSRFKYGLRGYRFSLLEAGHVGQNALLAASSLGLGAVPLGGLYEGRVEELLGVNGVDESLVYALAFGRRAAV
jgi:SagB-type dehydrogenase family enzyme